MMLSSSQAGNGLKPAMVICLTVATLALAAIDANAQGIRLFGRKPAKQEKVSYDLTDTAGPWLIMCAAFDGEHGQQDAFRLAEELRTVYKQKVYIYHRQNNIEKKISDKGLGFSKPVAGGKSNVRDREMKLYNGEAVRNEYAVLIGDFKNIDDETAQKTLAGVKQVQPQSLNHLNDGASDSTLSGARIRAQSDAMFGDKTTKNWMSMNNQALKSDQPLRFAFLMANPVLADNFFEANRIDPYLVKINTGLPNSLLDNDKPYSVKIASFKGITTINENEIEAKRNRKPTQRLMQAEQRASILASYLRKQGVEAYEFHDRYESYVCVGGFEWVTRDQNGEMYTNPEVQKVMQQFSGRNAGDGRRIEGYPLPAKLLAAGITCDSNPRPVMIPKVEVKQSGFRRLFR
ncbi:MAG: hypothetical protein AAFN77_00710 [Planctomycetota bacterium]